MATQTVKITKRSWYKSRTHKPKYNRDGTAKPQKKRKMGVKRTVRRKKK